MAALVNRKKTFIEKFNLALKIERELGKFKRHDELSFFHIILGYKSDNNVFIPWRVYRKKRNNSIKTWINHFLYERYGLIG